MIVLAFYMLLSVFVSHCNGDYNCLCNYNVETPVYKSADSSVPPIGYMYEFDCKYILSEVNPGWTTIAFEHKIGFVERDSGLSDQICPGAIPTGDKLPTTTTSTKAAITTTVSTLISSPLSTTLPLQTVSNIFSKSSTLSSLSPAPLLTSTDSFSSSLAYTKPPVTTEHQTTFSVLLLNKSSLSTSPASKTLPSLLTTLHLLSSASTPPSSSSSLNAFSTHFNVLSTSSNSSFLTTTLLSSDKTYTPPFITYGPVNVSSPIPTTNVNITLVTSVNNVNTTLPAPDKITYVNTTQPKSDKITYVNTAQPTPDMITYVNTTQPAPDSITYVNTKLPTPDTITNVNTKLPTPDKITHVNTTLPTPDKITSLDTATVNEYSSILRKTSSDISSTFTLSANSDFSTSSSSSSTLYDILRTSELPSMSAAPLSSESSSGLTTAPSTDSNYYINSSTKLSNIYSTLSLYNSTLFPYFSTAKTYSTYKPTSITSHSEISSEMPDFTTANSSVSTSSFSTVLKHSSGNSMTSLETSQPTRSSVEETTMTSSLTNMNTISTVSENRTHGTIKDRTDLCPYEYLATSEYNSKTYTYPLFRQYGNFCYELRLELGSWFEGQSDCVKRGGELAIINNSEVQGRLSNLTSSLQHKMDVWIGLHDLYQEGRWEWVDGEKLTQSSYNNGILITRVYNDARDCVVIDWSSGVWKNAACQSVLFDIHSYPWICQYRITT